MGKYQYGMRSFQGIANILEGPATGGKGVKAELWGGSIIQDNRSFIVDRLAPIVQLHMSMGSTCMREKKTADSAM